MISPFFPHYREELAQLMEQDPSVSITWVCDTKDFRPSGIPPMNLSAVSRRVPTTCHELGGLVWQTGVLRHAFRSKDRVHVYSGDAHFISTWLAAPISRLRGRRVYFWTHGWRRRDGRITGTLRSAFYRLANDLLLYGPHAKRLGIEQGFSADRLHVIYNSMGAPLLKPDVPSRRLREHQNWIVVSRLTRQREVAAVIRQVARLSGDGRHVRLTIVGDGPQREELVRLSRELGVEVNFLGAIYDDEVTGRLLAASDICLSPGHVGLAAVHALSCGCPVATHSDPFNQMPEYEAVRDGLTGVLYPQGDYSAMADRAWHFVETTDPHIVGDFCHAEVLEHWTAHRHWHLMRAALTRRSSMPA